MLIYYEDGTTDVQPSAAACHYHSAAVDRATKCWICCGKHVSETAPCSTSNIHMMHEYRQGELDRLHQLQETPVFHPDRATSVRFAVAIDCEMGTARNGDSELIRLSAIDYLTGEVLINNLVKPDQPILHLNTKWSGVTWDQMNEAVRQKTTLKGTVGARRLLWKFMGPDTVLVGHSVHNDLKALKWIHTQVVDSYIIEHKIIQEKKAIQAREEEANEARATRVEERLREITGLVDGYMSSLPTNHQAAANSTTATEGEPKKKKAKGTGDLALKTLLKKYLATDIQTRGKKGHDSLEDATAARDLVHWMTMRRLQEKYGEII
ncbi:RNA exonuclease 1 [Alternaria panax]|uniref:RNA exonuclease 1 n=1 Tax=Alternaria panax TaxID=48097 RepID=A0AAD4ICT7_9PLEO|nr:RNA exonuclease 1 [Alternaria panax]